MMVSRNFVGSIVGVTVGVLLGVKVGVIVGVLLGVKVAVKAACVSVSKKARVRNWILAAVAVRALTARAVAVRRGLMIASSVRRCTVGSSCAAERSACKIANINVSRHSPLHKDTMRRVVLGIAVSEVS
ncbi:MAG: hypothetical protein D6749_03140 [Chloroflexota bacterium]|nr:MAG: hypothetical protein D6749_03140 [Chloroflexota bacterium]